MSISKFLVDSNINNDKGSLDHSPNYPREKGVKKIMDFSHFGFFSTFPLIKINTKVTFCLTWSKPKKIPVRKKTCVIVVAKLGNPLFIS